MSLNICSLLITTENHIIHSIDLKADWSVIFFQYQTMMSVRSQQVEIIHHCVHLPSIPCFYWRLSLSCTEIMGCISESYIFQLYKVSLHLSKCGLVRVTFGK